MRLLATLSATLVLTVSPTVQARTPKRHPAPHNVILVVIDGLRGKIVTSQSAPTLAQLRDTGTYFSNSHSVFSQPVTSSATPETSATRYGLVRRLLQLPAA